MTTIDIQRYAHKPRTTLDGIPPEFFEWAELIHGWDRTALLEIGRAAGCSGNALDELVDHYLELMKSGNRCCSCGNAVPACSTYGGLLRYCEEEFPLYATKDQAKFMSDDALTAAGLVTERRCRVGI